MTPAEKRKYTAHIAGQIIAGVGNIYGHVGMQSKAFLEDVASHRDQVVTLAMQVVAEIDERIPE